jgi:hypothetical protein
LLRQYTNNTPKQLRLNTAGEKQKEDNLNQIQGLKPKIPLSRKGSESSKTLPQLKPEDDVHMQHDDNYKNNQVQPHNDQQRSQIQSLFDRASSLADTIGGDNTDYNESETGHISKYDTELNQSKHGSSKGTDRKVSFDNTGRRVKDSNLQSNKSSDDTAVMREGIDEGHNEGGHNEGGHNVFELTSDSPHSAKGNQHDSDIDNRLGRSRDGQGYFHEEEERLLQKAHLERSQRDKVYI